MKLLNKLYVGLKAALKQSWQNYPEALVFAYLFGALSINRTHHNAMTILGLNYDNVLVAALTAFPLFLVVAALDRRFSLGRSKRLIGDLIALVLTALVYISLPSIHSQIDMFRIFVVNVSLYLGFTLIPFFYAVDDYDISILQLISRLSITLLYSLVLIFGTFSILFALDNLLGISIESDLYMDCFIAIMTFFAPTFLLGDIPDSRSVKRLRVDLLLKKLHVYVMMPLILIYSAILYLYFGKVVIAQALPKNMIVHLTLWYALIAILTVFFTNSFRAEFALSRWFDKWIARILILPVGVMMFSLYLRISQYGITVKRYFVLALALWCVGVIVYFLVSAKRVYQNIVIAAIVVMLITMYGPFNAFALSFNSQFDRLTTLLESNDMLAGGALTPNSSISNDDKAQINALIKYFKRQNQLAKLPFLLEDFNPYDDMETAFGFTYDADNYARAEAYINYYAERIHQSQDIAAYNAFYDIEYQGDARVGSDDAVTVENRGDAAETGGYTTALEAGVLNIALADGRRVAIPLLWQFEQLRGSRAKEEAEPILIDGETDDGSKWRFMVRELSGQYNESDDEFDMYFIQGILFIE